MAFGKGVCRSWREETLSELGVWGCFKQKRRLVGRGY